MFNSDLYSSNEETKVRMSGAVKEIRNGNTVIQRLCPLHQPLRFCFLVLRSVTTSDFIFNSFSLIASRLLCPKTHLENINSFTVMYLFM